MTATLPLTESTILARVIMPDEPLLAPGAAEQVLKWTFSDKDRLIMSDLSAKARAGTLTDAERALIEEYGRIDSFISIAKSKARRALKAASEQ